MGVINMAHGEFMMIGAFTTYVVSQWFYAHLPALVRLLADCRGARRFSSLRIRGICLRDRNHHSPSVWTPAGYAACHLGIWDLVLVQSVRVMFGDSVSVRPPSAGWKAASKSPPIWSSRSTESTSSLFCVICIVVVYWIVNRTKLGLLLRATSQNREMAAALGVATRRVDAFTFALGCGLAGLAGVVVPLYNKINPNIGQEYIVDSFMVVVVGGVGKLAGAIIAGLGLGFISKYLEPIFQAIPALASGASVIGRVVVLGLVIIFLQWRPSGSVSTPKGRMADASNGRMVSL